ncbi:membrane protein [Jeotgalicoccus coquinae]|uniref:Nucleoside recognition n=1 Tax=Jeotgalicoccus coquinae TaxID=709509 RepID=A0A6V7R111_9STAP|nr:YjiH family protein [Jeotgalicoccus coquinae]MBB6423711.1 nucleoside recognition membrane protein YjiH [Jeotgalicoccus coquinae]GGE22000.1 membrane protein [Jeotgalicoccus coquinae]CAD2071000.1 Nucleoside recognition [Jeotgalicoccus coquinae]
MYEKDVNPEVESTPQPGGIPWKFIIPSLIGISLFLIPFPYDGQWLVGIGLMAEFIQNTAAPFLVELLVIVLAISAILSAYATLAKPDWITEKPRFKELVVIHPFWLIVRIIGGIFAVMVYFQVGPAWLISDASGGEVLNGLLPILAVWTLVMGMLLPLLVDFGLMEWLGTMAQKIMRPLFKLPGRSAVDALASWMGNNMVSILITINQYENGYYSKRESAVIVTSFTITSIGFALIIATILDLGHMFVPFYLTVTAGVLVAALICPRIPPLSRISNDYYEGADKQIEEEVPNGYTTLQWAYTKAVNKAEKADSTGQLINRSIYSALDIWLGMLPVIMSIGTIAMVIAEFTILFDIISYPLIPVLEWMQIPEAAQAAPALLVGFADMFLPALLASGIESELTRFVVGAVSLTQLIYLSEIGVMLIRSKIPINFWQLLALFLIRTIITLPIVVVIAHFIVF